MKKSIRLCGYALLTLILFAGCSNDTLNISGEINGLENQIVSLSIDGGEKGKIVLDTAFSRGGKFTLKTKTEYANIFNLSFDNEPWSIRLYSDAGNVGVKADYGDFENALITGSPSNDYLKEYEKLQGGYNVAISEKSKKFTEAGKGGDVELMKQINSEAMAMQRDMSRKMLEMMNGHPEELASMFIYDAWAPLFSADDLKGFYGKAKKTAMFGDSRLVNIKTMMERAQRLAKGMQLPRFELVSVQEASKRYDPDALKGSKLAIFFTYVESAANSAIIPMLLDAQKNGSRFKPVVVLDLKSSAKAIAMDFISKNKLENTIVLYADNQFMDDYSTFSEAKFILADENGIILGSSGIANAENVKDILDNN